MSRGMKNADHKGDKVAGGAPDPPLKMVGLMNQGATCYLNSLLQTLYHLSVFRVATFHLPEAYQQKNMSSADPDGLREFRRGVPFALARIFYNLQTSATPVSTAPLTDSFGWGTSDVLEQHDVQELLRKLIDFLEDQMKGTKLNRFMRKLLMGESRRFTKCLDVPFQSSTTEEYYDIQLCVQGVKNLEEALRRELIPELLSGENAYHAYDEEKGIDYKRQRAKRGLEYLTFPPVLFFHLRRFEYDPASDQYEKVNSSFEFGDELDLAPFWRTEQQGDLSPQPDEEPSTPLSPLEAVNFSFLSPNTSEAKPLATLRYRLHSVMVHRGTLSAGHFYAFVRADGKSWYKFDDEKVSMATPQDAIVDNYGGQGADGQPNCNSAYMLVYVQSNQWDYICGKTSLDDIPPSLREELRKAQREEEERREALKEIGKYYEIVLHTDETIKGYVEQPDATDLVPRGATSPHTLRIAKAGSTWGKVEGEAARATSIARPVVAHLRERANHTRRFDYPVRDRAGHEVSQQTPLESIFCPDEPRIELYVGGGRRPARGESLIFIKVFQPAPPRLQYTAALPFPVSATVKEVGSALSKRVGASTPPDLWEEVRPSLVVRLDPTSTLKEANIASGDIIVGQFEKRQQATPLGYYEAILTTREITLRSRSSGEGRRLRVKLTSKADEIAKGLGVSPSSLRLFHADYCGNIGWPVSPVLCPTVEEMLRGGYHTDAPLRDVLWYEVSESHPAKLRVEVAHYSRGTFSKLHTVFLPKEARGRELLAELSRAINTTSTTPLKPDDLSVVQVEGCRIERHVGPTTLVSDLRSRPAAVWVGPPSLRSDVLSDITVPGKEGKGCLVQVCHVTRVASFVTLHGDPFLVHCLEGETRDDFLVRVAKSLGVGQDRAKAWPVWVAAVDDFGMVTLHAQVRAGEDVHQTLAEQRKQHPLCKESAWHIGLERPDETKRAAGKEIKIAVT